MPTGGREVEEYIKKGYEDNKVADALSRIETRLDPDTVTELLNHTKAGAPAQAETDDIRIIEEEERGRPGGYPPDCPIGSPGQEIL